jgi:biofilm PGA synthesis protein PgaD
MKYDSRLIRKPYAQAPVKRAVWGFVTAAFWGLYIYMWLPLITLLLWLMGVRTTFFELYARNHHVDSFLVFAIPAIATACALVLITWAEYNRLRFSSRDRRAPQRDVTPAEVAQKLGATSELAEMLGQAKVTTLRMSERAEPESMQPVLPLAGLGLAAAPA